MLTLRYSDMLLKTCNHSFRRHSSCWRLLVSARSGCQRSGKPTVRRCFCSSSASSQSSESNEDALLKQLSEMRSRMSKLHNIESAKGVALTDYKRIAGENEEQDVSSSASLKDDHKYGQQFEDSCDQVTSTVEGTGKRLRKHKDVDVLVNMPYGHIRFDSMNKDKSTLRRVSEETSDVLEDDVPSVKIIKDGHHVFSVNAAEENEQKLEPASEDTVRDAACHSSLQREMEVHDEKPNMFDEQYFDDVLPQEEGKQRSSSMVDSKICDPKPNLFDEQYFSTVLKGDEQKPAFKQERDEKQIYLAKNTTTNGETHDSKPNVFDEQYFGDVLQHEGQKQTDFVCRKMAKLAVRKNETHGIKPNIFDEQYFGEVLQQKEKQQSSQNIESDHVDTCRHDKLKDIENSHSYPEAAIISDEQLSLIDEQYCGSHAQSEVALSQQEQEDNTGKGVFSSSKQVSHQRDRHRSLARDSSNRFQQRSADMTLNENVVIHGHDTAPVWKEVDNIIKDFVPDDDNTVIVEPITRREMKARTKPQADLEHPKTAYDLSMKIRQERRQKQSSDKEQQAFVLPKYSKWSGRVDSRGFRILQDQVVDVQQLTEEEVILILKDSIIHEDDKLVVIDKPYGLPSHGGPGIHHSIGKLLEPLTSKIDKTGLLHTLYLVHRLDKETTGVMLLAKSLQVAELLLTMFKKHQVVKHYWAITKSIPQPQEGVIDIPMAEGTVGNRYRMALRPLVKADGRPLKPSAMMGQIYEAVTNYRVLSENGSAALVECTPETGVKHQIRCHLAFGLNTPILGDHKYSHYNKIAPQKLHPEMLQMLRIRQAKVRHVPMHLHAKAIVLPEWTNGRNLFLSARPPAHFTQNMKWLRLKP